MLEFIEKPKGVAYWKKFPKKRAHEVDEDSSIHADDIIRRRSIDVMYQPKSRHGVVLNSRVVGIINMLSDGKWECVLNWSSGMFEEFDTLEGAKNYARAVFALEDLAKQYDYLYGDIPF